MSNKNTFFVKMGTEEVLMAINALREEMRVLENDLEALTDDRNIQAHADDVKKVVRVRESSRKAAHAVAEFEEELTRLKEWIDDGDNNDQNG